MRAASDGTGLRARQLARRLWRRLRASVLAGPGRRWAAAHVRRRDTAIRHRRLLRMVRARDGFTTEVRETVREAAALRRDAVQLLSTWVGQRDDTPVDALTLRTALARNAARPSETRARLPAIRACLGAQAARAAQAVLEDVERLTADGVEAVESRLAAIEDPQRGLLLRASGPGAWLITPDAGLRRSAEEALRRFEAAAAGALDRAGWDPERDPWAIW